MIVFPDNKKVVEACLVVGTNFLPLFVYALDQNRDCSYKYLDSTTDTIKTVAANTTYTVRYRYFAYE